MKKLIELDAALDAIGKVPDYDDGMVFEALSHAQRDVALLPPVDAVPVVRCRDCRFSQRINDWVYQCYVFNVDKTLNQYCDMGERKDGDSHDSN